ncbi:hypothetical protein CUM72_04990 [Enterococcus durans]|nr:hypothetical protein CUM72_04990 [Enterococcus durans]TKN18787.1 hypothetical protein DVW83_05170 [Enterococcus sp. VV15]
MEKKTSNTFFVLLVFFWKFPKNLTFGHRLLGIRVCSKPDFYLCPIFFFSTDGKKVSVVIMYKFAISESVMDIFLNKSIKQMEEKKVVRIRRNRYVHPFFRR